jgi:Zn-dependent membrane protease YugP
MISNFLLGLGILTVLLGYFKIILLYVVNLKKNNSISGNETARKLLNDDSVINVIENKSLIFSKYNIKRKMLKLSSKDYDGENMVTSAITSLLSGYAISDSKYLNIVGYVFKELKFITFSPIVTAIISLLVYNIGDAKIGLFLIGITLVYQYLLVVINGEAYTKISNIENDILDIVKKIVDSYTIFFVSSLIFILRLIVIIIDI